MQKNPTLQRFDVAQVSKPAVSPTSKSARHSLSCGAQVWKPAIQQTWKSALLGLRLPCAVLLLVAAGLAACSKSAKPGSVDLKTGLVAHWSAARLAEISGVVMTGAVAVVSTDSGKVFSFSGAREGVVVPDASALNFRANQDFSITARIQPRHADTAFGVMSIVDKRRVAGITGAEGYALALENGRLGCQLAPATRWPTQVSDFTSPARAKAWWLRRKQIVPMKFVSFGSPGPDLRDGKFHDVALTVERKSPTGGKLFVDGQLVYTFDPTKQSGTLATTAPLLIGGHPDAALNCGFKGLIGDVRLYSRALTATEVEALRQE